MTNPLSSSDLAAIEARAEAAPEGPWVVKDKIGQGVIVYTRWGDAIAWHDEPTKEAFDLLNFIAAARTDIPLLIAEIKRLKGEANG